MNPTPELILNQKGFLAPSGKNIVDVIQEKPEGKKTYKPLDLKITPFGGLGDVLTNTVIRESGVCAHNFDQENPTSLKIRKRTSSRGYLTTVIDGTEFALKERDQIKSTSFFDTVSNVVYATDCRSLFYDQDSAKFIEPGNLPLNKPVAAVIVLPVKHEKKSDYIEVVKSNGPAGADVFHYDVKDKNSKYVFMVVGYFGDYPNNFGYKRPRDYILMEFNQFSSVENMAKILQQANEGIISSRELLAHLMWPEDIARKALALERAELSPLINQDEITFVLPDELKYSSSKFVE